MRAAELFLPSPLYCLLCVPCRPLEDWGKLIGDVPSATAILDRFLHRAEVLQITGKSYRLGNRENGPKGTKAPTGSATEEKDQ